MLSLDPPKLRLLSIRRFAHKGQEFALLEDPFRLFTDPVLIPIAVYHAVVRHFDGRTSLTDIQARVLRETGELVASAELRRLVEQLDRALVLDGPTFAAFHEAYRRERVRPAALAGLSYEEDEQELRAKLRRFFAHERGGGFPRENFGAPSARLRGVLSPHIDFDRGGHIYSWAYKELVEHSDAEVFVILGVAHQYCRNRFALTRKDFQTPLGLAPSDRAYVDQIAERAGPHLFEDELAHRLEHSVEFQVVFLQYLLGGKRPFAIVPILVGSFHDLMEQGIDPIESDEVRRFIEALRAAEVASGKKVAYIGGIDLCHVGPEFGDPAPIDSDVLDQVRRFDQDMLARASALDPKGWFGTAAEINNRWRVCGLAATYTMLHALAPARGRLLRYDQAVDARRTCCVTFASLAFDAPDTSEVRHRA
jgi:MEMO1 family protein